MLPNWLYGKSKSKLAELLGGGGTPSDYNEVKAQVVTNTEDIALLSNDLNDKAAKTQLSNPNIFHNPWFAVNQRAITSATQNTDYIADRWMVYFGENNATITRNASGNIIMDNTLGTTNITIYQKRTQTYLNSLVGKKLTASMMLSDGTIYSGTITYTGTGNSVYFENDYVKAHAPVLTASQIITYSVKPGASVTIKALKLEVGEISTLHLDPRPEYATELAKCQRYFIRLGSNTNAATMILAFGVAINDSQIAFALPLPSQMRTQPTVSASSLVRIERHGSTTPTGTPTITIIAMANNIIRLGASGVTNISTGAIYDLVFNYQSGQPAGYIDFNAEL